MRDTMGAHVKLKGPTSTHRKSSHLPPGRNAWPDTSLASTLIQDFAYPLSPGQNVRHKQLQGGNFIFSNGLRRLRPWILDLMPGHNDDKKQKEGCRTGQAKQRVQGHIIPTDLLPPTGSTSYPRHFPTIPSHYNLVKWLLRLLCWTSQDLTDSETSTQTNQEFALLISWAFLNPIKWQLWLTI